jgi:hypothetical protein
MHLPGPDWLLDLWPVQRKYGNPMSGGWIMFGVLKHPKQDNGRCIATNRVHNTK